jgi:hypothetical protein
MNRLSSTMWLALFLLIAVLDMGHASAGAGDPVRPPVPGLRNGEPQAACRAGMYVYESERGRQLLGEIVQADLPLLLPDWDKELATYVPNSEDIAVLAEFSQQVEIICVLGTWCHDSEREVPRFWKILKEAANPNFELTMFAVGRSSDPEAIRILQNIGYDESLRAVYDVELVPTFIFSIAGREIGRIIETPNGTLEGDMAGILMDTAAGDGDSGWH